MSRRHNSQLEEISPVESQWNAFHPNYNNVGAMDCREKTLVYKAMAQIRSPGSCSVGHFEVWSAIQSVILVVEEVHYKYMQATGTH